MQNQPVEPINQGASESSLHEQYIAARVARSIVVTDDTPRGEIPDQYLAIDPERWDGLS